MSDERIEAKLLPKPNWAREVRLYVDSAEEEAGYRRIQERWHEIDPKLHQRIEEFFNDPHQAFLREEDGFPLRERLTGEYYIGDAGCHHHDCDSRLGYYCSVMSRCLEAVAGRSAGP